MVQKTITTQELQADFGNILAQMQDGQEVLVMDGQTPLARLSPVAGSTATPEAWEQLRVQFSAIEFPFP